MKAEEARKISEQKKATLEQATEIIKANAQLGHNSVIIHNLNSKTVVELMHLGYKVGIHKDPINGMEHHTVSW